jgi:hypothetical protein
MWCFEMDEELYVLVLCIWLFIIGMYVREKIYALFEKRKREVSK